MPYCGCWLRCAQASVIPTPWSSGAVLCLIQLLPVWSETPFGRRIGG